MIHPDNKKKIAQILLPLVAAFLVPLPPATGSAQENPQAIINSCATPERKEGRKYRRPLPMKGGPVGGYGMVGGAPAPMMDMAKTTKIAPFPPSIQPSPQYPPKPRKKGPLDLQQAGKKVDKKIRKASELYLSNDDSMSLASAQRIIYAIDKFLPVYRNEIRPHELLNFFHFKTNPVATSETFSVNFEIAPRENGETLALAVQGKKLTKAERRPAVITLILDKSGSMRSDDKMAYLKEGLKVLKGEFKKGDVINVVEFDHETCNAMEGFVVGRDAWKAYETTVEELAPRGSTNLHDGLVEGYKLADKFYNPSKINRVILVTDAIANTGQLDPELMASIGRYYDKKKIALSGIGVGLAFNDDLLNELTDAGKGAYLFLGIKEAIPRVFGSDFISLLDTVARDVHFKTTFPKGIHLDIFYGEEVSTEKSKVQAIHYFANTSQLFLLDLLGKAKTGDQFQLQIEFEDPIKGGKHVAVFPRTMAEIKKNGEDNIAKARLIMALASLLEKTALPGSRPYGYWRPRSNNQKPEVKGAKKSRKACAKTLAEMKNYQDKYSDEETRIAVDLADKYCTRFY